VNCPACRAVLVVLEHELVEVDFCPACKGVWLDAGELELLFGDAEACAGVLAGGEAACGEGRRRCPRCRARMSQCTTSGTPAVTYDRCPKDHGLWLDAGELESVLSHGKGMDGRVACFLHEVFHDGSSGAVPEGN
jgi:Zn-finger nucleic acid-binding protein